MSDDGTTEDGSHGLVPNQYAAQRLEERPIIRIAVTRAVAWSPDVADDHTQGPNRRR